MMRSVKSLVLSAPEVANDAMESPFVSIIIPVFNGENILVAKVENCLAQEYAGNVEVIIVSDGSNDKTAKIATSFKEKNVSFIELESRMGKSAAQNRGVEEAKGQFILFTDVDSMLTANALQAMMGTLQNTKNAGCVGARVFFKAANVFQRLYWSIETELRLSESQLGILSSVSGAAILLEKTVFRSLDLDTGDDMVIPLDLKLHHGLNTVYTVEVLVKDRLAKENKDILNSRRRITRRNLLAVSRRKTLLNPIQFGLVSVSILSRKILRWLTPFILLGAIVSCLFAGNVQTLIYVSVAIGLMLIFFKEKLLAVAVEFLGLALGVYDFVRGYKTRGY